MNEEDEFDNEEWHALVTDLRGISDRMNRNIMEFFRLKHDFGLRIVNDPQYGKWQKRTGLWKDRLQIDLGCSRATIDDAITFVERYPDFKMFLTDYEQPLIDGDLTWKSFRDSFYEHREPEGTETALGVDEIVKRVIDVNFSDRFECEALYRVAKDYGIKTYNDANELVEKVQKWRQGEKVYTFLKNLVPSDYEFERAVRLIAPYVMHKRQPPPLRGLIYEELDELHELARQAKRNNPTHYLDVPENINDFFYDCAWIGMFSWRMRLPRHPEIEPIELDDSLEKVEEWLRTEKDNAGESEG